ncbi:nuclear transport factor 2 family protein [Streptomyces sp. NPDC050560]|uniref:nuclear transport factor 2 family protein n=1 Tax=Streptomyces sp. NPDC050560 TaxID=3365630 RepID=UPI0037AB55C4
MTTSVPGPLDVLGRYRQAVLDKSADDLAGLYAVDAVHEFPFVFPGTPARYEGREEVRAGCAAAWAASSARPETVEEIAVHRSDDPEVIIVEQRVTGTDADTGEQFAAPGLLTLRVHEGLITHARDYTDALGVARAPGVPAAQAAPAAQAGPGEADAGR